MVFYLDLLTQTTINFNHYLTPNSENNRIFLSDLWFQREFPVLYSTLTQTPNTVLILQLSNWTSTKGYTIDLI
jgi:hypothetical protein